MKINILKRPGTPPRYRFETVQHIDYDFVLEFEKPFLSAAPKSYLTGQPISSPARNGNGDEYVFEGAGFINAVSDDDKTYKIYVEVLPDIIK